MDPKSKIILIISSVAILFLCGTIYFFVSNQENKNALQSAQKLSNELILDAKNKIETEKQNTKNKIASSEKTIDSLKTENIKINNLRLQNNIYYKNELNKIHFINNYQRNKYADSLSNVIQ